MKKSSKNSDLRTLGAACLLSLAGIVGNCPAVEFATVELPTKLQVGYAVRLLDMNSDNRLDICIADAKRILWLENPNWTEHIIDEDRNKTDNVCFAPLDINHDGLIDFAVGADWTVNTKAGGTIGWLMQNSAAAKPWDPFPIATEPTVHRMQFIDIDNDGREELIVLPLMGRNTTRPNFAESGVRILAFSIPENPTVDPWPMKVLYDQLHVTHNFVAVDMNHDGRKELLVVSFEGISLLERPAQDDGSAMWKATLIGEGDQQSSPNKGASEVKLGTLAGGQHYIATIEPWHGNQVVVYTPPDNREQTLWNRDVLDDRLKWGHAVYCANIDEDADEELIIGVRDDLDDSHRRGLRIYDPVRPGLQPESEIEWKRTVVDPGAVAIEDLAVGDLDQDGDNDIVTVGRQTNNVKIYYNIRKQN